MMLEVKVANKRSWQRYYAVLRGPSLLLFLTVDAETPIRVLGLTVHLL
jgi:hypothetical protein